MSTNDVTSVTSKISSILNAFYCKDPLKLQFPLFLGSKDKITSELKGQYAIIASFVGTEGYWGLETTTYLTVSDAPAPYPTYPGY